LKRIGFITSQAYSLINFRGSLIRELVARNIQVFAFAPDLDDVSRKKIISLGAEPIDYCLNRTKLNPVTDIFGLIHLFFILHRLKLDVSIAYFIKPVIYGTFAAWIARVPKRVAMIEGLGFVFTDSEIKLSIKRKMLRLLVCSLYKFALRYANTVIFLNRDDIELFVELGLVESKKIVCLGGIGVDLQEWIPTVPVVKPVTFILCARLLKEKGILEYVESARKIKLKHQNVRFILLGGLDSNPGGLSLADVEGWVHEDIIEWPGHVSVKHWLAGSSVYVLPSYREGVPRSTQEAMAMGKPVITTDVPGCRETVIDGVNGFMVPSRDIDSLVQAMERFILDPKLIVCMGVESRRLAEERFDSRKVNAHLISISGLSSY
jgi:glycosyltransferase involved in cell wall biosynthesis